MIGRVPQEIEFRPLAASDIPTLTRWLGEPHVRKFYQRSPITLEQVALEYGPLARGDDLTICHMALGEGRPFAYLQCYRNADYPEWVDIMGLNEGISTDFFVGEPAFLHRGFGQAALGAYLRQIAFRHFAGEARATIAHASDNVAALRCSQAVGFKPLRPFLEDGIEMVLLATDRVAIERAGW